MTWSAGDVTLGVGGPAVHAPDRAVVCVAGDALRCTVGDHVFRCLSGGGNNVPEVPARAAIEGELIPLIISSQAIAATGQSPRCRALVTKVSLEEEGNEEKRVTSPF